MKKIALIAELNPFHNGHSYIIKKIKKMYKDALLIIIMSGNYTMRGEISILNEYEKTHLALLDGADLIIKLPFVYSSQSADTFSDGALKIASLLKADTLVFGSETSDKEKLIKTAQKLLEDKPIAKDLSYPKALNKAYDIDLASNDILAVSYIKEIIKNNYQIDIKPLQRTSSYNDKNIASISSATAIRNAFYHHQDYRKAISKECYKLMKKKKPLDIYPLFKYKVLSERDLTIYNDVDKDLHYKFKNNIHYNNIEDFLAHVKTKEITINRIKRCMMNIILNFYKEDNIKEITNIRVLGFSKRGRTYLNKIKKEINLPFITNAYKDEDLLKLDNNVDRIYDYLNEEIIDRSKPLIKE